VSSIILWRYSLATLFCFFALIGMPPANVDGTAQQDAQQKAWPEMDRLKKLYLGSWDTPKRTQKRHFIRKAEVTRVFTPANRGRAEIRL